MIYARDVMPSKKLAKHNPSEDIEAAFDIEFLKMQVVTVDKILLILPKS